MSRALILSLLFFPLAGQAQKTFTGRVVYDDDRTHIALARAGNALIKDEYGKTLTRTAGDGSFAVTINQIPTSIIVNWKDFRPDTIVLTEATPLVIPDIVLEIQSIEDIRWHVATRRSKP